ncbi:hypothetical protein [Paracoccus versutus]|uniref:hypothetical protein n=1 Tax=Paracoccus versutus TaxID=34007 RepID=UPI0011C066DA|nr:hypothetical protein [Paracoccus versutus]
MAPGDRHVNRRDSEDYSGSQIGHCMNRAKRKRPASSANQRDCSSFSSSDEDQPSAYLVVFLFLVSGWAIMIIALTATACWILDMSLTSIIYGYLGGGVFGAMVAIIGSLLVHETRHDAG